jgi:PPOX class probable F420-dependent enzyme
MRRDLTPDDLSGLLNQPHLAVLATSFPDGTTLLSPVWHEWRDGGFTILVGANDVKARHIRRDPRVSVVVADDLPPYAGIEVRARAEIVPTDGLTTLRRLAVHYLGQRRGKVYADGVDASTQLTLRIVPGVLRTWDFADEAIYQD